MDNSNWTWNILQNLLEHDLDFAILILNQPILCNPQLIKSLWDKGALRGLVDGGSNRWFDFIREFKAHDLKLPDFISGDFDSLKPETKTHFAEDKVNFILTSDQDESDFTKSLRQVFTLSREKELNIRMIFAICENSGRFDQILGNINTLHLSNRILQEVPVIIVSSQSITWLLRPGKHTIFVPEDFIREQYSCGLIPFCGPTVITTSGLKWNLDNQFLEFGGLISTSNTFTDKKICIQCDKDLVWTTQFCKIDK